MGKIAIRNFTGEIPKLPTHLLPDTGAQRAVNCDFTHGDLRPLRSGSLFLSIGFPAKTVFSDDGGRFVGFPGIAYAYKSPVIGDVFQRFYYIDETGFWQSTFNEVASGTLRRSTDVSRQKVGALPPASITASVATNTNAISLSALGEVKIASGAVTASTALAVNTQVSNSKFIFTIEFGSLALKSISVVGDKITGVDSSDRAVTVSLNVAITTQFGQFSVAYTPAAQQTFTSFPGSLTAFVTPNGTNAMVTVEAGVVESVVFAATQTNRYLEESAPVVSSAVGLRATDTLTLRVTSATSTLYPSLAYINVYKSASSGSGFVAIKSYTVVEVAELPRQDAFAINRSIGTESFASGVYTLSVSVNNVLLSNVQTFSTLTTSEYKLPPDGMSNLILMPNGFFAASKGNTLYFSEPYRPHAWVSSMTFPTDIVGVTLGEQQLVVTTKANPYIVVGVAPDTLSQQRLPDIQAGFSSRSMTNSNGLVVYASRDGLVTVNGPTSSMAESQALFTREDWRNRYDSVLPTMQLTAYDGRLFGVNPNNTNGFLLRLDEAAGNYTQMELQADAVAIVPRTDSVYYSQNNQLFEFGTGPYMTAVWHSKEFILPRPSSFAAGFINSNGSVTIDLFTDEGLFSSQTVNGRGFFRIRSGQPSRRWSIRLTTQAIVKEFLIAESMRDLQNG